MLERVTDRSYETIRRWTVKFGTLRHACQQCHCNKGCAQFSLTLSLVTIAIGTNPLHDQSK